VGWTQKELVNQVQVSLEKKSKSVCVLGAIVGQGLGCGFRSLTSPYFIHDPYVILEGSDESSGRPHLGCVRPQCCQTASPSKASHAMPTLPDNSQWIGQNLDDVYTSIFHVVFATIRNLRISFGLYSPQNAARKVPCDWLIKLFAGSYYQIWESGGRWLASGVQKLFAGSDYQIWERIEAADWPDQCVRVSK